LSALLVSVVLARTLGVEQSGVFFAVFAVVSLLANVSRFGLDNTILRIASIEFFEGRLANVRFILKKSISIVVFVSVLLAALFLFFIFYVFPDYWMDERYAESAVIMMPGVVFWAATVIVSMHLAAIKYINWSVFFNNISISAMFLSFVLIFDGGKVYNAAAYYSLACFLTFIVALAVFINKLKAEPGGNFDLSIILKSCFPLWLVVIMGQITQWSSQIVASAVVSSEELAVLAVAQRASMIVSFVLLALDPIIGPRLATLYKNKEFNVLERFTKKIVLILLISVVPVFLVSFVFAENILNVFGEGFAKGEFIFRVMLVGQLVNVITGPVTMIIIMTGNENVMRNIQLFSGGVAAFLAMILVGSFGVVGGGFATAIAISVQNLVSLYYAKKILGYNFIAFWK